MLSRRGLARTWRDAGHREEVSHGRDEMALAWALVAATKASGLRSGSLGSSTPHSEAFPLSARHAVTHVRGQDTRSTTVR